VYQQPWVILGAECRWKITPHRTRSQPSVRLTPEHIIAKIGRKQIYLWRRVSANQSITSRYCARRLKELVFKTISMVERRKKAIVSVETWTTQRKRYRTNGITIVQALSWWSD